MVIIDFEVGEMSSVKTVEDTVPSLGGLNLSRFGRLNLFPPGIFHMTVIYLYINLRRSRNVFVPSFLHSFVPSFVTLASVRFGQLLR